MLADNIKAIRKARGLSQEGLAHKLNVVRQTISKWEQGLSVPDSDMLVALSNALETPVIALLGEAATETKADDLKEISDQLEIINLQLASIRTARRKRLLFFFMLSCGIIAAAFIFFIKADSPYLSWDYSDPESAVMGVAFHASEWLFVRLSPLALTGAIAGIILTWVKS